MATKKRLTQREKAERAAAKKRLQAQGVLPPDKPRLNRKKFARETWAEWEAFLKSDPIRAEVSLLRAVEFIAGPELPAVTPEQVGIYKALKLAVEYNKFLRKLEAMLLVADRDHTLVLTGTGDVIEPDDGIASIGSGGPYALSAARALVRHSDLGAEDIALESMKIASELCVFTNGHYTLEVL